MSFKDLKKNRGRKGAATLADEAAKMNKPGEGFNDERFWKPTRDKSDNGFAVIRFLPAVNNEDIPWVRVFSHGFQDKGGWYIENCPTTIGGKCPLCEANNELWNSGTDANKDIARNRKRRLQYIANILVISDPKNPENNGKNFLYKFGVKIFTKAMDAMSPEFEDEEPMSPFDFWDGADFKLKIRRVKGYVNYDKSEFAAVSPLLDGDDEALEALWKQQHALQEFIGTGEYKEYDVLKKRLLQVLTGGPEKGASKNAAEASEETKNDPTDETPETPSPEQPSGSGPAAEAEAEVADVTEPDAEEDSSVGALEYFEELANED